MSRNLLISENPFVYGFIEASLKMTNKHCGLGKCCDTHDPLQIENAYPPPYPVADHCGKKNYISLTPIQKGAYHLGRTVRVAIAIPGSLADLTMQLAQIIFMTIEYSALKVESVLTEKEWETCATLRAMKILSPSFWVLRLQNITTVNEPSVVACYFGYFKEYKYLPSLSSIYREKLCETLFW